MSLLDFNSSEGISPRNHKKLKYILGIGVIAGVLAIGSTLAANINLNTSHPIEFGQGIASTTACDNEFLITPTAGFVNATSEGSFMFTGITFSGLDTNDQIQDNLPQGCVGKVLKIKAYGTSGEALKTYLVNVRESFFTSPAGSFTSILNYDGTDTSATLAFDTVELAASDVYRITIESAEATCATGGTCIVGDRGPGGGIVFYADNAGFACGPDFTITGSPIHGLCNYLEAAPTTGTYAWTDTFFGWSGNTFDKVETTGTVIGAGYKNTLTMVAQAGGGSTDGKSGTISRAYREPSSLTDWYLPSIDELHQLYLQKTTVGGFLDTYYWSSSDVDSSSTWYESFDDGEQGSAFKTNGMYVRPIRAF